MKGCEAHDALCGAGTVVQQCLANPAMPGVLTTFQTKGDIDVRAALRMLCCCARAEARCRGGGLPAACSRLRQRAHAPRRTPACLQGVCTTHSMDGCQECTSVGQTNFKSCPEVFDIYSRLCVCESGGGSRGPPRGGAAGCHGGPREGRAGPWAWHWPHAPQPRPCSLSSLRPPGARRSHA